MLQCIMVLFMLTQAYVVHTHTYTHTFIKGWIVEFFEGFLYAVAL